MNPVNFDSIIEFIGEFFSELPPAVVAAIAGIGIFAIIILCGFGAAFVISFLIYGFTQLAMLSAVSFIACIAISAILGIFYGYRMYRNIKLAYQNQTSE